MWGREGINQMLKVLQNAIAPIVWLKICAWTLKVGCLFNIPNYPGRIQTLHSRPTHLFTYPQLHPCMKHVKPGLHTVLAGRTTTRDSSRCMDTNDHKWSQHSQQKLASWQQSRTCWTFARPVPWYAVTVISRNQQCKKLKRFSVFWKKRAKPKTKKQRQLSKSRYL